MVAAARIANRFGLDPVELLAGPIEHFRLRAIAARICDRDDETAMKAAKNGS